MDDLFLQILEANEKAQIRISDAQGSKDNNIDRLKKIKKEIDTSSLESFNKESNLLLEKTKNVLSDAEKSTQQKLEERKKSLKDDFEKVSSQYRAKIIAKVINNGE